jgi:hypothetical protein
MTLGRTIKRACAIAAASAAALALGGVTASADGGGTPDHGHILLIGVTEDGFRKCVDLAGGKSVPLVAHHERVHATAIGEDGRGINVKGIRQAGHAVVPTAPITPWADCAGFAEFMGAM